MNNTLTYPGLSYSHSAYIPRNNGTDRSVDRNVSASSSLSSLSYTQASRMYQMRQTPTTTNAKEPASTEARQHFSLIPQVSSSTQPNAYNSYSKRDRAAEAATTLPFSNMYATQGSMYINPYMSMEHSMGSQPPPPPTAVSSTHPHLHPSNAMYAPPRVPHHHAPHHTVIAPPPGFSMHSSHGGGGTAASHSTAGMLVPSTVAVSSNAPYGGYAPYAVSMTPNTALVPYNTAAPPALYRIPTYSPASATSYRYPQAGNYCAAPTPQYSVVDAALVKNLRDAHLSYLNTDDSLEKLDLKKNMEDLVQCFVSVTPDEYKYQFPGVRDVLQQSIKDRGSSFDGFKAGEAFEALASYAGNLIVQPWRQEYRVIKLYSGYWVHKVAEHLSNADTILKLMGYVPAQSSASSSSSTPPDSYSLPSALIDVDIVARLALDCHIACSECQILKRLHQEFPEVSYSKLLQFRRLNAGAFEDTALSLLYLLKPALPPMIASTASLSNSKEKQQTTGLKQSLSMSHVDDIDASLSPAVSVKTLIKDESSRYSSSKDLVSIDEDSLVTALDNTFPCYDIKKDSSKSSPKKSLCSGQQQNNAQFSSYSNKPLSINTPSDLASSKSNFDTTKYGADTTNSTSLLQDRNSLRNVSPASLKGHDRRHSSSSFTKDPTSETRPVEHSSVSPSTSLQQRSLAADLLAVMEGTCTGGAGLAKVGRVGGTSISSQRSQHKESFNEDNRHTKNRKKDMLFPTTLEEAVRTAQLIDHRGDCSSSNNLRHVNDNNTSALLPKVLPHYRSSSKSGKNNNNSSSNLSDCYQAPTEGSATCTLPSNIPIEVFQDKDFEEHISESYNRVNDKRPISSKKSSDGGNYKDTWGFVLSDLEKKGYNKDVGNRGDILHTLTNSKPSNSNQATNICTSLTQNQTTPVQSTVRQGYNASLGNGEVVPKLIPSTINAALSDSEDNKKPFNMAEAMEQLELAEANAARKQKSVVSPSSSATLNKDGRNAAREVGRYEWDAKQSSDGGSLKRTSVYDNVSYGGFETARQDTDDEDLAKEIPHHLSVKSSSKQRYKSQSPTNSSASSKYVNASGSETLSGKGSHNKKSNGSSSDGCNDAGKDGGSSKKPVTPWSCISCTYYNENQQSVCEMCSRSRQVPGTAPIKSLVTGGLQCPQCTLINEKDSANCSACGISLESCATYI